jgi:hypothetical protein
VLRSIKNVRQNSKSEVDEKNSADLGDMINTFEGIVDIPLSKLFSKSNFGLLSKG